MTRLTPKERQEQIIEAAYELAIEYGFLSVHAGAIALKLGIGRTLVQHYFSSKEIENLVLELGVARKNVELASQIIRHKHPLGKSMSKKLRGQAIRQLFNRL